MIMYSSMLLYLILCLQGIEGFPPVTGNVTICEWRETRYSFKNRTADKFPIQYPHHKCQELDTKFCSNCIRGWETRLLLNDDNQTN